MLKTKWMLLITALIFALSANVAWAEKEEVFKLRWGHYLASGPFLEIEEDFCKKIEERTNGRVKIDIIYSGGLGKGRELFTLAGRGAIDMAAAPPGYYADQLHFWKAFQIPFFFSSPAEAIEVLIKSVEEFPIFMKEMDNLNVHWLFQQPLGSYYLTGKNPAKTLEDLKGKKIRSFGMYIPQAHRAVGAVPVNVTAVDIYESLQRGVIDYSFLNGGNIAAYRLYEVAKYTIGPLQAFTGHNIVIGNPTWNKLPKDIQDIFTDQAQKTQLKYLEWLQENSKQALQEIKEGGGIIMEFPELAEWKAQIPDLVEQWVNDLDDLGYGEKAREVADRWKEIVK